MPGDKDHQTLFVGGPNTCTTNPRWRTAVILKNRKIAVSPQIDRPIATKLLKFRIFEHKNGGLPFYRQHCTQRNTPVFKLLRGRF